MVLKLNTLRKLNKRKGKKSSRKLSLKQERNNRKRSNRKHSNRKRSNRKHSNRKHSNRKRTNRKRTNRKRTNRKRTNRKRTNRKHSNRKHSNRKYLKNLIEGGASASVSVQERLMRFYSMDGDPLNYLDHPFPANITAHEKINESNVIQFLAFLLSCTPSVLNEHLKNMEIYMQLTGGTQPIQKHLDDYMDTASLRPMFTDQYEDTVRVFREYYGFGDTSEVVYVYFIRDDSISDVLKIYLGYGNLNAKQVTELFIQKEFWSLFNAEMMQADEGRKISPAKPFVDAIVNTNPAEVLEQETPMSGFLRRPPPSKKKTTEQKDKTNMEWMNRKYSQSVPKVDTSDESDESDDEFSSDGEDEEDEGDNSWFVRLYETLSLNGQSDTDEVNSLIDGIMRDFPEFIENIRLAHANNRKYPKLFDPLLQVIDKKLESGIIGLQDIGYLLDRYTRMVNSERTNLLPLNVMERQIPEILDSYMVDKEAQAKVMSQSSQYAVASTDKAAPPQPIAITEELNISKDLYSVKQSTEEKSEQLTQEKRDYEDEYYQEIVKELGTYHAEDFKDIYLSRDIENIPQKVTVEMVEQRRSPYLPQDAFTFLSSICSLGFLEFQSSGVSHIVTSTDGDIVAGLNLEKRRIGGFTAFPRCFSVEKPTYYQYMGFREEDKRLPYELSGTSDKDQYEYLSELKKTDEYRQYPRELPSEDIFLDGNIDKYNQNFDFETRKLFTEYRRLGIPVRVRDWGVSCEGKTTVSIFEHGGLPGWSTSALGDIRVQFAEVMVNYEKPSDEFLELEKGNTVVVTQSPELQSILSKDSQLATREFDESLSTSLWKGFLMDGDKEEKFFPTSVVSLKNMHLGPSRAFDTFEPFLGTDVSKYDDKYLEDIERSDFSKYVQVASGLGDGDRSVLFGQDMFKKLKHKGVKLVGKPDDNCQMMHPDEFQQLIDRECLRYVGFKTFKNSPQGQNYQTEIEADIDRIKEDLRRRVDVLSRSSSNVAAINSASESLISKLNQIKTDLRKNEDHVFLVFEQCEPEPSKVAYMYSTRDHEISIGSMELPGCEVQIKSFDPQNKTYTVSLDNEEAQLTYRKYLEKLLTDIRLRQERIEKLESELDSLIQQRERQSSFLKRLNHLATTKKKEFGKEFEWPQESRPKTTLALSCEDFFDESYFDFIDRLTIFILYDMLNRLEGGRSPEDIIDDIKNLGWMLSLEKIKDIAFNYDETEGHEVFVNHTLMTTKEEYHESMLEWFILPGAFSLWAQILDTANPSKWSEQYCKKFKFLEELTEQFNILKRSRHSKIGSQDKSTTRNDVLGVDLADALLVCTGNKLRTDVDFLSMREATAWTYWAEDPSFDVGDQVIFCRKENEHEKLDEYAFHPWNIFDGSIDIRTEVVDIEKKIEKAIMGVGQFQPVKLEIGRTSEAWTQLTVGTGFITKIKSGEISVAKMKGGRTIGHYYDTQMVKINGTKEAGHELMVHFQEKLDEIVSQDKKLTTEQDDSVRSKELYLDRELPVLEKNEEERSIVEEEYADVVSGGNGKEFRNVPRNNLRFSSFSGRVILVDMTDFHYRYVSHNLLLGKRVPETPASLLLSFIESEKKYVLDPKMEAVIHDESEHGKLPPEARAKLMAVLGLLDSPSQRKKVPQKKVLPQQPEKAPLESMDF